LQVDEIGRVVSVGDEIATCCELFFSHIFRKEMKDYKTLQTTFFHVGSKQNKFKNNLGITIRQTNMDW